MQHAAKNASRGRCRSNCCRLHLCLAIVLVLGCGKSGAQERGGSDLPRPLIVSPRPDSVPGKSPKVDVVRKKSNTGKAATTDRGRSKQVARTDSAIKSKHSKVAEKSRSSDEPPPDAASEHYAEQIRDCRQRFRDTLQPSRLIRIAEDCERTIPVAAFGVEMRRTAEGARKVIEIQRSSGLSADLFEDMSGDAAYRDNLGKALRGDREAAYHIAVAYRSGHSGVAASPRRMEQWLRFATELGNGLASWELSEFYNYGGLVADAARFEKRALELGYRPPVRLPTRGY